MKRRGVAVLQVVLFGASLAAHAVVKNETFRITVVDEETHLVTVNDTGVPKNCDFANFDAYCHNSRTTVLTNILLVQESKGEPYRVTCTVETKWSRCKPLLKGASFDARKEKRGLLIYYLDEVGKLRKQLYTYVDEEKAVKSPEPASNGQTSRGQRPVESTVPAQSQAPGGSAAEVTPRQSVSCSFTSIPSGADILIDGRYMGSTPSVLNLSEGVHSVTISLAGFSQWQRELTVSSGSQVAVNAVLEGQ